MASEIQSTKSTLTWPLLAAAVVTFLGSSVPAGYNIGVINTPQLIIKEFCNQTIIERYSTELSEYSLDIFWSWVVSVYIIGGTLGSFSGCWFADKWGRKGAILVNNLLGAVAAALFVATPIAKSVEMLIIARFLVGLSSGLTTSVVPMYMMEVVTLDLRGPMGVLCPLGICFGVLVSQILGLEFILGSAETWHYLLGLYGIPVLICMAFLPYLPESPKYLFVIKKDEDKCTKALSRLRGLPESALKTEILETKAASLREISAGQWGIVRLIKSKSLRWPLILVCAMQGGQQLSGINAVFYYSVPIFLSAGLNKESSQYASIGAGVVNFLVAALATFLIGRFRRRALMLFSCTTVIVCLLLLAVSIYFMEQFSWLSYVSVVAMLSYVFFYGLGLGPIPYFIASELFTVGPRSAGMALGSMANWGANFLVGMTFPSVKSAIGALSFLPFATSTVILTFLVWKKLPETFGIDPAGSNELSSEEIALQEESPTKES
ncbi:solute carrier family 2, facilitated glucose transporter member 3-like [Neocloeon triangulifer]|uniref:solute carrier family 2, facilitated glucose transporter member 3-like n=1 Tax=Neocloeon triangulifer TaxID=2078957 RepID=UPI00286EDAC0|nr:solute carrier family 2, facilitated glucose transporter member 3-like [Neocloeon triangulifer]